LRSRVAGERPHRDETTRQNIELWRHPFSRVTFDFMFPLHLNHKASQLGSRFWNI
jgi:hypothetical protein